MSKKDEKELEKRIKDLAKKVINRELDENKQEEADGILQAIQFFNKRGNEGD